MASTLISRSLVVASSIVLAGCANGPCRQLRHPELAGQPAAPVQAAVPAAPITATTTAGASTAPTQESTVLMYKADGSLQCKAAKGMALDEMEKQLSSIKVFSRDKRSDGLMHIQVCGSPTGQINVYEIQVSSQKEAEKRGFKKLDHR